MSEMTDKELALLGFHGWSLERTTANVNSLYESFSEDYIRACLFPSTIFGLIDHWRSTPHTIASVRAEAALAERERIEQHCELIAADWRDSDQMLKWYAFEYLRDAAIRARTATQGEDWHGLTEGPNAAPASLAILRTAPQTPASRPQEFDELRKSAEKAMGGTIADRSAFRPRPTHVFDLLEAYDAAVAALASRTQEGGMREALERGLKDCRRYAEDHDDEWVPHRVDDALAEAATLAHDAGAKP